LAFNNNYFVKVSPAYLRAFLLPIFKERSTDFFRLSEFMAYVSVPKDMTEVKTRLIMNLTKRQLICFGAAAAIGAPLFLSLRGAMGNTGAMILMIAAAIPAFFFAIYNKDGVIPAEKYLLLVLRQKFFYPKIRVYRTQNMYAYLENGVNTANTAKEGYFGEADTGKAGKNKNRTKSRPIRKTRHT